LNKKFVTLAVIIACIAVPVAVLTRGTPSTKVKLFVAFNGSSVFVIHNYSGATVYNVVLTVEVWEWTGSSTHYSIYTTFNVGTITGTSLTYNTQTTGDIVGATAYGYTKS
jgi:hypothetical protein